MSTTSGKHTWENRWFIGSISVWFTLSVLGMLLSPRDHDSWLQLAFSGFCFFATFLQRRKHLGHF
jgi:hypothetical protein